MAHSDDRKPATLADRCTCHGGLVLARCEEPIQRGRRCRGSGNSPAGDPTRPSSAGATIRHSGHAVARERSHLPAPVGGGGGRGESTSTATSGACRVTVSGRIRWRRSARKNRTAGCRTSYSSKTMSSGAARATPPDVRACSCSSRNTAWMANWCCGSGDGTTPASIFSSQPSAPASAAAVPCPLPAPGLAARAPLSVSADLVLPCTRWRPHKSDVHPGLTIRFSCCYGDPNLPVGGRGWPARPGARAGVAGTGR